MRKPLRALLILLSIILISSTAHAATAPKVGGSCKKFGQTITTSGKKFTCVKSGKKLVWNKGVAIAASKPTPIATPSPEPTATPTPAPTPTTTPTAAPVVQGQECKSKGARETFSDGYFECRPIAQQKLIWFKLSNAPSYPLAANKFSDSSACKISNTNESKEIGWHLSSSFPLFEKNLPAKGVVKVAIVGIDFSDVKGDGLPGDIATVQMAKVNKFFKQYSNGTLSYEFIFVNKWIRLPQPLSAYKVHGPEGATRTWPDDLGLNLIKDVYKASDPEYNFTDVKSILVVTPRSTPVFYHSALIQYFYNPNLISTASLTTNEGLIRNVFVGGGFDYAGNTKKCYGPFGFMNLFIFMASMDTLKTMEIAHLV
jgi:hypothetical protein